MNLPAERRTPDEQRERALDTLKLHFIAAKSSDERRELFNAMRALMRGRSRSMVERLERQRGIG